MANRVHAVRATVEVVHVVRGLWCKSCALPSARKVAIATTIDRVMNLCVVNHCDDCSTTVRH